MKTTTFFLSIIFVTISNFSMGQIDGYLRNKANNAAWRAGRQADREIDKKINKKIDEEVSDAFNKEDSAKNKKETSGTDTSGTSQSKSARGSSNDAMSRAMMGKMGISMERPANIKDKYDFKGNLVMTTQAWDENGESEGEMLYTTYFSDNQKSFAMDFKTEDKGNSRMIFDMENHMMIVLSEDDGEKTGMVMGIDPNSATPSKDSSVTASNQSTPATADYYSNFKKTGKTKTVSGYSCEEYVYEDNESKAEYWMTDDLPAELWANMFNNNTVAAVYAGKPSGFIMEWTNENKLNKEKSTMVVKEVNKNQNSSFSTVDYSFITMKTPESKEKQKK